MVKKKEPNEKALDNMWQNIIPLGTKGKQCLFHMNICRNTRIRKWTVVENDQRLNLKDFSLYIQIYITTTREIKNKIAASFCTDNQINILISKKVIKVTQKNDVYVNALRSNIQL